MKTSTDVVVRAEVESNESPTRARCLALAGVPVSDGEAFALSPADGEASVGQCRTAPLSRAHMHAIEDRSLPLLDRLSGEKAEMYVHTLVCC